MSNTLNLGGGKWARKEGSLLAYNSENSNFKPLPFTFDRGSSATVVNKQGLIETVGTDEPRIDFLNNSKGHLLLEPERRNIVPYSEDFNNVAWNKISATITPNDAISPDGTQNSDLFVPNSSGGQIYDGLGSKAASAISYTTSLYVKPKGLNSLRFYLHGTSNANRGDATFDLSNQTVTFSNNGAFTNTSASILSVGNGWYRCILVTTSDTSTTLQLVIRYDGSTDNVSGLNLWGCQVEQGSYATSYIPTQGSAVTRSAETTSQTPPSGIIGQTEGTMYLEFNDLDFSEASIARGLSISDGTYSNRIYISQLSSGAMYTISSTGCEIQEVAPSGRRGNLKVALGYKNNDYVLYVNGVLAGSDAVSVPSCSKIYLGQEIGLDTNCLYKPYKEVKLYNTRLSNIELQALTS